MSRIAIAVNYYSSSVIMDPEEIADDLLANSSEEEVTEKVSAAIREAIENKEAPSYTLSGKKELITMVRNILERRRTEEENT